uniref:hypothetical protein n=1 Tax=Faecalibacterium sp. TaxID=1971605 RepID=UPI0040260A63
MRLYKKAAAVLLAAAMAVSMMTACGGGAGGGSGVVPGVTYHSNAALVAGVDADSIKSVMPIKVADSRYAAFIKNVASNPTIYEKVSTADVVNGQLTNERDIEQAQTEKFMSIKAVQNGKTVTDILAEKATNGVYTYTFVDASERKAAVRFFEESDPTETPDVPGTSETPSEQVTISSAQVTVANKPYYAEIIQSGSTKNVVCYEADKPVPTYEFTTYSNGVSRVAVYNTICFGTDNGVIDSRLSGYTVYTVIPEGDSKTKGTLKNDKTGDTYDVTLGKGDKGYTVEKNGVEVNDIDWLIQGLMKKMTSNG